MRYFIVFLLCFIHSIASAADSFWEDKQWTISGYLKTVIQAPNHQPTKVELDDLSLFVSANVNRWINPFLEAELFSIPLWESGQGLQLDRAEFIIERLYNDFKINDDDNIRVGKFLSPLNRWNLIHAAPLVWTTNRPVTTTYSFANYITGIKYRHEFDPFVGHAIEFFWQPYQELDPKPIRKQGREYQGVLGATWILHDDLDAYYALTMQHDNVKNSKETRTTWSFDLFFQQPDFELESELLLTLVDDAEQQKFHDQDWGGYIQLTVPMPLDLNIVTRYEHFQFTNQLKASDTALAGLVYKPRSDLLFKLEWQQTWGGNWHNETGLYSSIAVLF